MQPRIASRAVALFVFVHVGAVAGVVALGFSVRGLALAAALYAVRLFAITAGVHRYFAHRTFKTSRAMQLVFAFVATTGAQLGVLWWASHHRLHHRYADGDRDPHSPTRGLWWAHAGWFLVHTYDETRWDQIPDFASYRELRWLDRHYFVPVAALIAALLVFGGMHAFVWGFCVSTVALWHAMFSLTSICHWLGRRRYPSDDDSRNSALVALATFGEGWHNNHHYYPGSARQGFFWWEPDVSYYGLRLLEALGLVWQLRVVPHAVRDRYAIDAERSLADSWSS